MSQQYNIVNGDFQHLILDGTAYDVGKKQMALLRTPTISQRQRRSIDS